MVITCMPIRLKSNVFGTIELLNEMPPAHLNVAGSDILDYIYPLTS